MQTKNLKLKTQNCGGRILIVAVITFCVLSGMAWSIENYSVGNPIGPSTSPPSSIRSGLIRSPNPLDSSGNLIITGNVSGSKYFRGPIPYGSPTGFRASLGSTSLDSFLRDSTRSDDFDRYIGGYGVQPYYSPTETVTTMTPGRSGVFAPSTTRIAGRAPDTFGLEDVQKKEISPNPPTADTSISDTRLPPTSLSPQRIKKTGSEEVTGYPRSETVLSEQYQEQMEQLRRELQRIKDKTNELKQKLGEKDESLQIPIEDIGTKVEPSERVRQQLEKSGVVETQPAEGGAPRILDTRGSILDTRIPNPESRTTSYEPPAEGVRSLETYDRIKKQLDNLQTSQTKEKASGVTEKGSEPTYGEPAAAKEQLRKEKSYFEVPRKGQPSTEDKYSKMLRATGAEEISGKKSPVLDEVKQLSAAELSAEAKRIMGPHKDIESLSDAKFNQYILAAQTYLKQGKFYRAADSYALASIYKKDDPATYGGRGHALFAAGEYISSALFISRAIEISAAYAQTKVDLVTILGDRDKLESRIVDVEEWVRRSNTAELQFLLGYLYYRIGKLDEAKQAIDIAYEKTPQRPAVQVVKKAIDDATGSAKTK